MRSSTMRIVYTNTISENRFQLGVVGVADGTHYNYNNNIHLINEYVELVLCLYTLLLTHICT